MRVGKLTVGEYVNDDTKGRPRHVMTCDCGEVFEATVYMFAERLKRMGWSSCAKCYYEWKGQNHG